MLKILLLSDSNSIHTVKWAEALSKVGFKIHVFSINKTHTDLWSGIRGTYLYELPIYNDKYRYSSKIRKIKYLKAVPFLRKLIKQIKPDIVHAHYASSYGLIGALSGFHPYIMSVWGTDVFDFPNHSWLNRQVLKYSLSRADKILSTSNIMKIETQKYTKKEIDITPFGVDLNVFSSKNLSHGLFTNDDIVIGTVKSLEHEYGVNYLIKAFKILSDKHPELPLKLLIVGSGSEELELKRLINKLDLNEKTTFTGRVKHQDIASYYNMISVPVFMSNRESFGVSIIEAGACRKPVVVSDAGGLPEVVDDGVTGFVVPVGDYKTASDAIEKLVLDSKLRSKMGEAARIRVERLYNWDDCVKKMSNIYNGVV